MAAAEIAAVDIAGVDMGACAAALATGTAGCEWFMPVVLIVAEGDVSSPVSGTPHLFQAIERAAAMKFT